MAKLFAIEEKQQKERAAEKAAANTTAPANISGAVNSSPPEIISGGENISAPEVLPIQPLKISAAANISAPAIFAHPEQHTRIPNEIFEDILPTLRPSEQSILLRLYRLTWGFQKDTCHVSMGKLAKSCNLSARQVTTCIQVLEKRGLIRRVHVDFDNRNQHERGVTFQMILPQAARAKSSPPAIISPAAKFSGDENISDNKVNTLKENTQTQEPPAADVRVGSKFTIEECRKYARHLQATGQGINNPGGYATTIHRTGEADLLIESFLHPEASDPSSTLDTSQCPDCHGTGFYYPKGVEGGVARCKHEQLKEGK
jgi:DNA-binding Lrp family transcriptional regulator